MKSSAKTKQLQIRVSPQEKALIERAAKRANMKISDWVLSKIIPENRTRFQQLVNSAARADDSRYALASLNDFLTRLTTSELSLALADPPYSLSNEFIGNYVAAMIEYAAYKKRFNPPAWVSMVKPLKEPYFGTDLLSLRLYLLTHSPPPFRRRNIFIDASIGDRL